MRLELINGEKVGRMIVAVPESDSELQHLMKLAYETQSVLPSLATLPVTNLTKKHHKKHKQHMHKKECDVCGQVCKGVRGLYIHKARRHDGKNWNYRGVKVEQDSMVERLS